MAGEDEGQFDRVAQLRADQQQQRIEGERVQAEETARLAAENAESSTGSIFGVPRDDLNDSISRFLAKPEPVELILGFIPYINLQLIWGQLITNGKSKFITPPSFKPWKLQWILPNILATVLVIAIDLVLFILILPSAIFSLLLLYLIGKAMTDPYGAALDAKNLLGAFGCDLVKWFGFPSILC